MTAPLDAPEGCRTVYLSGEAKDQRTPVAAADALLAASLRDLEAERGDLLRRLSQNSRTAARLRDAQDALLGAPQESA